VTKGAGASRAFGDDKGSGPAMICEMLTGAFTGGGTSGPTAAWTRIANSMLSIFLSPRHLDTQAEFERMGLAYAEWVADRRPANPLRPVLLPGQPEASRRTTRIRDGIPLPPAVWASLRIAAERLGVPG
jgi:uncharacterized oxidoreductase